MTKFIREPINIVDVVVEDMRRDVSRATVRRVLWTAFQLTAHHIQEGNAVLLPEVGILWAGMLRPRRVKSNLPGLKGREYRISRVRYRLKIEPKGRTGKFLRHGRVYVPGRRVTGGPDYIPGAEGSGNT